MEQLSLKTNVKEIIQKNVNIQNSVDEIEHYLINEIKVL